MMNSRTRARLAVSGTALALPLAVALSACSAGSSSPAAAGGTSAAKAGTSAARAVAKPATITNAAGKTVKVPKYVAANNVRKDVQPAGCLTTGGSWELKGTATNPGSSARSYSVVVDFVTTKGDTVVATKVLDVGPVQPKATVKWSAKGAAGAQNITCVIRQALAK